MTDRPRNNEEILRDALKRLNPLAHKSDSSWYALDALLAERDAARQALQEIATLRLDEELDTANAINEARREMQRIALAALAVPDTEKGAELVARSAQNADTRADADSVPGYKDQVFALAAEVAVLVCVRDVAHVDDRPGRKRLDQAANEIGYLLGLPQPEFAEIWAARSDRSVIGRATSLETDGRRPGGGINR